MKKIFNLILIIILLGIVIKACLRRDCVCENPSGNISVEQNKIIYPSKTKNVVLNGIDFLQSQAPIGKYGGDLIITTIGEGPKTFNPCNTKDATSSSMAGLMYEGLVYTDSYSGEVRPLLAKSFEINGNDYIFSLRKGIVWSDGKPITADDVLYTYNEIVFKGLGNPSTMDAMKIEGVLPKLEKIDDYTLKFTTVKPFAPFLRLLSYPIVPKHYFKKYSDKGEEIFNTFLSPDTNPKEIISNGPFKLKEYIPAQRVVFDRNPMYYKINTQNQRLPYLNKVVYLIVGDTNNEILKFEANEIDVLNLKGSNVAFYKQSEYLSNFKIYNLGPDTGTLFIAINLNNQKDKNGNYYVNPIKQQWFRNKNFRNALDYALNRQNMVDNVAFGVAKPLFTAESLNSIYLNKNIKGHEQNLEYAKKLLVDEGFYYKNYKLYDVDNNRVEFNLFTNAGNLEREALAVMIKEDFEQLGIKVNFKPIEFNTLVNKLTDSLDWDLVIMGLTGSPLEPHDGKNVWTTSGILHIFNQCKSKVCDNDKFEWEKELDKIFKEGAEEISYEKRKSIYDKYQEIIYEEKPMIYLFSPIRIIAVRNKLKNIFPSSLGGILHNLDEIYIDEGCK